MQGHRRFREHKINVVSASAHACLRPSFIIQHESSNMDMGRKLSRSQDIATKVSLLLQKRLKVAQDHYTEEIQRVYGNDAGGSPWTNPAAAANAWSDWYAYMVDSAQRSILFWDTLR